MIFAALICAWAVWQPERSDSAVHEALTLVTQGRFQAAIAKANDAHRLDPLSPKPLLVKSALQDSAGQKAAALATLQGAVIHQPSNPQLWLSLADYELNLHNPNAALQALGAALYLDPLDQATRNAFLAASAASRGKKTTARAASRATGHVHRTGAVAGRVAAASALRQRQQGAGAASQRHHLEAELVQHARERAAREEADVGRERVEARSRSRVPRRPSAVDLPLAGVVIASVPPGVSTRRASDRSSWTSRTCSSVSAQRTSSNSPSPSGSGASGSSSYPARIRQPAPRTLERHRRDVGQRQLGRVQLGAQPSVAATEVERPPHRAERAHELHELGGRRPRLLGHELPELVVVAARRHHPRTLEGHAARLARWPPQQ